MGLFDKLDTKVKHLGSKQSESSEVNAINKKIKEEENSIDLRNAEIGEFYWNLYAEGKFTPVGESAELFKSIVASLKLIENYKAEIESRRVAGEEERKQIEEAARLREEQKAAEAEERRKQQEAERKQREEEAEAKRRQEAGLE